MASGVVNAQFGMVVVGPPGSGKTTFCRGAAQLLASLGRKPAIVNLDPANQNLPYAAAINVCDLIQVEDAMEELRLGPNGGLVYCMETLEKNMDWLLAKLKEFAGHYLIIDAPGQAELFVHHSAVKNILQRLEKENFRLCAVNLIDSHYASDPGKYVSALLLCMSSMLNLELPLANVLSKVDIMEKFGKTDFDLNFYTEVLDLNYLTELMEDDSRVSKKYRKLTQTIAEVVSDYGLLSFTPLAVDNRQSLINVVKEVDKANGYVYGSGEERSIQRLLSCAVGAETTGEFTGTDAFSNSQDDDEADKQDEELLRTLARGSR